MKQYQQLPDDSVIVLLAPGFSETQMDYYAGFLRQNSVPVSMIGLSIQSVNSINGCSLSPDYTLNQLPPQQTYPLVLMLGGYDYLASLMADPRVHQLIGDTLERDGYVAADETAESMLPYTNAKALLKRERFLTPKSMEQNEFAQYLIDILRKKPVGM